MIEQNTVVVFILGGKVYKLVVGTVFAVIIYTGYFDFVVDNGIGIAQDVEALSVSICCQRNGSSR